MKKRSTIFSLVITACVISSAISANAQDRRRDGDRKQDHNDHNDHHERNHHNDQHDYYADNHRRGHRDKHHHHDRHVARPVYHYHDRYCDHRPVVVHRHVRPRYIYYRDYDVYYDSQRSVYISYSGRNWTVTKALPVGMRHVNIRTTKRFEVDYHDDDFPRYLETQRPSYGRECEDW